MEVMLWPLLNSLCGFYVLLASWPLGIPGALEPKALKLRNIPEIISGIPLYRHIYISYLYV